MIYGYIRVSSDKQTVENQRFEINEFIKKNELQVDHWVHEVISGVKNFEERKLGKLLKGLKKGDVLLCSELSRLGRNLLQIMTLNEDTEELVLTDSTVEIPAPVCIAFE